MTQHTPAPWKKFLNIETEEIHIYSGDMQNDYDHWWIATTHCQPEQEADANLIAAAPELLEVLESILSYEIKCPKTIQEQAAKVVAKARGES